MTDFSTFNQYLMYLQKLAAEANMPHVNVSLGIGAAINAFKCVWNFPDKFNIVLIYLDNFHFIKENFGVIAKLIAGLGFQDVVFQSEYYSLLLLQYIVSRCSIPVCSCGSFKGVLAGSHYNRACILHACFSEALERLFF